MAFPYVSVPFPALWDSIKRCRLCMLGHLRWRNSAGKGGLDCVSVLDIVAFAFGVCLISFLHCSSRWHFHRHHAMASATRAERIEYRVLHMDRKVVSLFSRPRVPSRLRCVFLPSVLLVVVLALLLFCCGFFPIGVFYHSSGVFLACLSRPRT